MTGRVPLNCSLMNGKYYLEYQGTCVNEAQQSGVSHITQADALFHVYIMFTFYHLSSNTGSLQWVLIKFHFTRGRG